MTMSDAPQPVLSRGPASNEWWLKSAWEKLELWPRERSRALPVTVENGSNSSKFAGAWTRC